MTMIGDKTIIFSDTFLVPDGDICKLSVELNPPLQIEIEFQPNGTEQKIIWKNNNEILHIIFSGYNSPNGIVPIKPVKLGKYATGEAIGLLFFLQHIGTINNLVITFLKGGKYD